MEQDEKEKCDLCTKEDFLKEIGNGYFVCKQCLEDSTKICMCCGTHFPEKDVDKNGISSIGENGDEYICGDCIDDPESGVVRCEGECCTHAIIYKSDAINDGDELEDTYYCEHCHNQIKETSNDRLWVDYEDDVII